jgi:hypothetical protein
MKKFILVILALLITNTVKAVPRVNVEDWTVISTLNVKVYDLESEEMDIADCIAFYIPEVSNTPIGDGANFYVGGMASVDIRVKENYKNKDTNNFEVRCVTIDNQ